LKNFIGEVAEWLKAPVSKTGIPLAVSRVRIPASPPNLRRNGIVKHLALTFVFLLISPVTFKSSTQAGSRSTLLQSDVITLQSDVDVELDALTVALASPIFRASSFSSGNSLGEIDEL